MWNLQHEHPRQLLVGLIATIWLILPLPVSASGLGWYYESFSWKGIQSYFGGGTSQEKRAFVMHMQNLVQSERKDPFYGVDLSPANIALWASFISRGIHYTDLSITDAKFADAVISIVMGQEAELVLLEVKSETNPDYVHPGAFRHMVKSLPHERSSLLSAFEFGRAYGQKQRRTECLSKGKPWQCHDAYIILSPEECALLSEEMDRILAAPSFKDSEFEERKFVAPLAKALATAAKMNRGMYLHTTD